MPIIPATWEAETSIANSRPTWALYKPRTTQATLPGSGPGTSAWIGSGCLSTFRPMLGEANRAVSMNPEAKDTESGVRTQPQHPLPCVLTAVGLATCRILKYL